MENCQINILFSVKMVFFSKKGQESGTGFSMSEEKKMQTWLLFFSRWTQFQLIEGLVKRRI